jgi:hypothetical protein
MTSSRVTFGLRERMDGMGTGSGLWALRFGLYATDFRLGTILLNVEWLELFATPVGYYKSCRARLDLFHRFVEAGQRFWLCDRDVVAR